jgi:hypothetical protein
MSSSPPRIRDLIHALIPPDAEGYVDLRSFKPTALHELWQMSDPGTLSRIEAWVKRHRATRDLYIGVAERRTAANGTKANCSVTRALHCEIDFKDHPSPEAARERLAAFPLSPSILVRSGGGLHTYWLLDEPAQLAAEGVLARVEAAIKWLQVTLGGDPNAIDASRVLRIPGTLNHKYTPKRAITFEHFEPSRRYKLSDFVAVEPAAPTPSLRAPLRSGPSQQKSAGIRDREQAIEILASTFPGIGSGVHYYVLKIAGWFAHAGIALDDARAIIGRADGKACNGVPADPDTLRAIEDTFAAFTKGEPVEGLPSALEQSPALEGVVEDLKGTLGIEVPSTLTSREAATEEAPRFAPYEVIDDDALFYREEDDAVELIAYHWQDFVPVGAVAVVLGAKKALKTWLEHLLSVSAASPTPLFEGFPAGNQRVLLLSGPRETSSKETRRRIRAIRRQYGLKPGTGRIKVLTYRHAALRLEKSSPLFDELVQIVCDFRPTMIVLDSAGALWGGKNENDSGEVRTWLEMRIEPLMQAAPGTTLYLLAHTGHDQIIGKAKVATRHQRGASAWGDATDVQINVTTIKVPDGDPLNRKAARVAVEYARIGEHTQKVIQLEVAGGPVVGRPVEIKASWLDPGKPEVGQVHPVTAKAIGDAHELVKGAKEGGLFLRDLEAALAGKGHALDPVDRAIRILRGKEIWPNGVFAGRAVPVIKEERRRNEAGRRAVHLTYCVQGEEPES